LLNRIKDGANAYFSGLRKFSLGEKTRSTTKRHTSASSGGPAIAEAKNKILMKQIRARKSRIKNWNKMLDDLVRRLKN